MPAALDENPTPKSDTTNKKGHLIGDLILFGAPDRIRTCDPQIRNLVLYPTELRALERAGILTVVYRFSYAN